MRFFAHDGKATHGPAEPDELLKPPGFDGDTLVCPVGSEDSADWKPALAYPPFRAALLAAAPAPTLKPLPPPPAAPPTKKCPRCAQPNPESARFCNACAARMDGREEPPPAPRPTEPPRAVEPPPAAEPEPTFDGLESSALPEEIPAEIETEPQPAPASSRSKSLLAVLIGATAASGCLAWWVLRPHAAATTAPVVADAAPAPVAAPVPSTTTAQALPIAPAPAPAAIPVPVPTPPPAPIVMKSAPRAKAKARAPKAPAKTRKSAVSAKRAAKKRRTKKTASAPAVLAPAPIPSAEPPAASETTAAPSETPSPAPAAEPHEDGGFLMPGIPRRVPPHAAAKPAVAASTAAAAPPAEAAPPEDSAAGATRQVREQFEFCAQLLSQGAYSDHFDTCLCPEAQQAAPYLGRRDGYAAALKKLAASGALKIPQVGDITLDGAAATVALGQGVGTERWQLQDGLWCRAASSTGP